jgi:hypothetical protein
LGHFECTICGHTQPNPKPFRASRLPRQELLDAEADATYTTKERAELKDLVEPVIDAQWWRDLYW